jgi:hypothetical protein
VLVVEGGASLYLLTRDYLAARAPGAETSAITSADTLVGWVGRPTAHHANEFGPGVGLTIDALGFRGTHPLAATPPAGALRIACSGDSFTFGYDVDDEHPWCRRLEVALPGAETFNLAQVDYGLDQAYLRYLRDGVRHAPAVHVLALTSLQFDRALWDDVDGRAKPRLALDGAQLVTRGVPVPAQSDDDVRHILARREIADLRLVQWLRTFPRFDAAQRSVRDVAERWPLFEAILASLAKQQAQAGTALVLVYLPARRELRAGPLDERRKRLAAAATRLGVPLLDLTPAIRRLRADSLDNAYIGRAPFATGPIIERHFSNLGNDWVAHQVAAFLASEPGLAPRLGAMRPGATPR